MKSDALGVGRLDEERLVGERRDQRKEVRVGQPEQEVDRQGAEDQPDGDGRAVDDPAQDDDRGDDRQQQADDPGRGGRDRLAEQDRDARTEHGEGDHDRRRAEGPSIGAGRVEHEQEGPATEGHADELAPGAAAPMRRR